jgi:hypothetical protein
MDGSSVYGFIKVPVAALRSRQQLGVTLACMNCSQLESNLHILDEDVIFQFANSSLLAIRRNYSDWIYRAAESASRVVRLLRARGFGRTDRGKARPK